MENDNLIIGKTIEKVAYDDTCEEPKIILFFDDNSSATISTNASAQIYYLLICE